MCDRVTVCVGVTRRVCVPTVGPGSLGESEESAKFGSAEVCRQDDDDHDDDDVWLHCGSVAVWQCGNVADWQTATG